MINVKVFDEEHEKDLELVINDFLGEEKYDNIIDIKYSVAAFVTNENEQIFCYSALIIYRVAK